MEILQMMDYFIAIILQDLGLYLLANFFSQEAYYVAVDKRGGGLRYANQPYQTTFNKLSTKGK